MTSEEVDEYDDLPSPARRTLPLPPTSWHGWVIGAVLIVWFAYLLACMFYGVWQSCVWLKHWLLS
jgi:hypothetical protein